MDNTENLKNVVSSIDDETLRLKVEGIMAALGIDPNAMGQKFTDVSFIRNAVMNMSEQDLNNIISTVGEDRAQQILRGVNEK